MCVLLGSCTPYELKDLQEPGVRIPEAFAAPVSQVEPPEHWWLAFDDPELNRTVLEAFDSNLSLKQAWARLDQALATATILGAPLLPDVNLDGAASRQRAVRERPRAVRACDRVCEGIRRKWQQQALLSRR